MSQAGIVDIEGTHPQIPTLFVANSGDAVPIANTLEILGTIVSAHGIPLQTTGSGNTVTIETQYASAYATSVGTNAGLASFNSSEFTVDANGFVSLSSTSTESFTVDTSTPPGTNPVTANGSGDVTVTGGQVAAGTTTNVIRTNSLAANTYTIQIQRSQAVASSTIGDNGVSHFNSTYFTVDANGFVSLVASAIAGSFEVDAHTSPGTNPVVPNGLGVITVTGGQVAAGTTVNVIQTDSLAANTYTIQIQRSQAVASSTVGDNGVSHFNSTYFTVDANGFVSLVTTGFLETLSDDVGTIVTPTSNNIQLVGHVNEQGATKFSTVVAGTHLLNINPMSSARWIVDPLGFNGTHTTIASALSSASSGDTIFLMPGTYTENPILKANVNLTAWGGDGIAGSTAVGNVTIIGECSASYSGSCTLSGITLQTNATYCLSVTGALTFVELVSCYIYVSSGTGINFTSSGKIEFRGCKGNIGSGGSTYFSSSGIGTLKIFNCFFENDNGATTTASTISSGAIDMWASYWDCPITTSSTGSINVTNSEFYGPIILAGTGSLGAINSDIIGGASSSVSIGSGTTATISNCYIISSNTNPITGSGTLNYGNLTFSDTYAVNVTTQIPLNISNDALVVKSPSSYPYTSLAQDAVIIVNTSSTANTINLNASPVTGQVHRIKDVSGNASVNNITVTPASGNIDGAASYIIATNYGSIDVCYTGSQWSIL